MKKIFKFAFITLLSMSVMSCDPDFFLGKEDENQTEEESQPGEKPEEKPEGSITEENGVVTVMLSRKTDYGNDWIYFSLKDKKELDIKEDKHMDDLTWDLAFNRYNVRTNGGASGKGQGGALDTNVQKLEDVKAVPAGDFTLDEKAMITSKFTGSGIEECESTLNKVLAGGIKFQGPPPSYTPSNHVYIVKTADGKFAKIQILGFHNKKGKSGYVSFRYVYQADGKTEFSK